jgi:peptidoglycan-N-acetylglucosamine deacetylase
VLNFKNTNLLFVFSIAVTFLVDYFLPVPIWIYLFGTGIYLLILLYRSYYVNSNFYLPVACRADNSKNEIALTFDDGPIEPQTSLILDILNKNNVSAAFFCIGSRMKENQSLLKQIDEQGHLIGNHSYSHHFLFDFFSTNKMLKDLKETDEVAQSVIQKKLKLFRPPYGVTTPNLARAILKRKYHPIGWSVRSMDTIIKNETKLIKRTTGNIKSGDIFLFHDIADVTVVTLQAFIDTVQQQGFKVVRLDKLLNVEAYAK